MKLVAFQVSGGSRQIGILEGEQITPLTLSDRYPTLQAVLEADKPSDVAKSLVDRSGKTVAVSSAKLLAPIDQQEVWAAGVTYRRSQVARMEESKDGASFYDKVYMAARPEIFFKANPHRVSGPGQALRIRQDATWNVPEPELALVINSRLQLVGFTVGNDMSSRDIEGENPLYLPQAKCYNACCGLGPSITLSEAMPPAAQIGIKLTVKRGGSAIFEGTTSVGQMARTFDDLISWLGRDNSFPNGVFLLTGTGIVPTDEFTLAPGDVVDIAIDGIGVLSNPIVQG